MGRAALLRLGMAAAAAALLLGPVTTASAHDVLAGSSPVQNGAVDTPPASVRLEFSAAPQVLGTEVVVTGPDGGAVSDGTAELSGSTVTQQLSGGLPAGRYTVDWRVTSADGHPITGSFAFDVARGSPAPAPAGSQAASPGDPSSFPVVWIVIVLIAAGAVVLVVRQLRRPT